MNRPTAVTLSPAPTAAAAPAASSVTFAHSYNKANQRIGQTVTDNTWLNYPAATPGTVSYASNALNQYTAVGAVTPTYDGNGNLTSDGTFSFGYDAENRLTSASGAGNTASYAFDAQGRRKTRTVNGTTTVFVTDAANREVLEYDGASGAILRWYAYGLGPNDVLGQMNVATATRATPVPDMLGSVIGSLDSGSGILSKVGYLPYGKSATASGPFGYTGQRIDPETGGLYYYRARHYSPAWGRFLQADPIGARGGINLYAYVRNDPINLVDQFGLAPDTPNANSASTIVLPAIGGASGAAAGGAAAVVAGGAIAVGCILLCPSQMGADLPMDSKGQVQIAAPVHGNSLDSQRQTYVYQLTELSTGEVLKYGITSEPNPTSRYPGSFYVETNSRMDVIAVYSNRGYARAHEIVASGLYAINNGRLPPLSLVP
jgi:RHS repeat-associated protein